MEQNRVCIDLNHQLVDAFDENTLQIWKAAHVKLCLCLATAQVKPVKDE